MSALIEKDPIILDVLERIRFRLGSDAFVLADHWESDLCAVGIASPTNSQVLVYISCYGELPDRFDYELELPPKLGSNAMYEVAGRDFGVTFDQLVTAVAAHLKQATQTRVVTTNADGQ